MILLDFLFRRGEENYNQHNFSCFFPFFFFFSFPPLFGERGGGDATWTSLLVSPRPADGCGDRAGWGGEKTEFPRLKPFLHEERSRTRCRRCGTGTPLPAPRPPPPPPFTTATAAGWGDGGGSGSSSASCGWAAWRSGRREQPGNKSRRRRPVLREERVASTLLPRTGTMGPAAPPPPAAGSAGEDSRTCSAGRDAPRRSRASAFRSLNPLPCCPQPRRAEPASRSPLPSEQPPTSTPTCDLHFCFRYISPSSLFI